jgi:tetratricopeptide (TPR) repeat protein
VGRMFAGWNSQETPLGMSVVFGVCLFLFIWSHADAAPVNAASLADRVTLQNSIEAGDGLSSRARKTLFTSRSKQDKGEYGSAAAVMGKWVSEHPDGPHHLLYFNWAVSQLSLDQSAEAMANLEQAVSLEPQFARAWLRLGEAAYDLEKYARAAEAFSHGYSLMPDPRPEILYYSGVAWLLADQGHNILLLCSPCLVNEKC